MVLLAIGYGGLILQTAVGGVLGWVSRAAQYFGGGTMLVAAYVAWRDTELASASLCLSCPQRMRKGLVARIRKSEYNKDLFNSYFGFPDDGRRPGSNL